jgi:hypothetical protein
VTQLDCAVPVDPDQVAALLEKLHRIPDGVRRFTVTPAQASAEHQLPAELLESLVEQGFPSQRAAGELRFERTDLLNVTMHLGFSPLALAARRFWASALNRDPTDGPAHYEIGYQVSCPEPAHAGPCRYALCLPGERVEEREMAERVRATVATMHVALPTGWPALPAPVRELLDDARGVEFMRLPYPLRRDLDFIRSARLADCAGTAELLRTGARLRGLPVRYSYGLIVVPPFSTKHNWAEVRVDDTWVPVDPVLLTSMVTWGVLDGRVWDGYRSPGAILCRVSGNVVALASHGEVEVSVTLGTRRLRAAPSLPPGGARP